MRLIFLTALVLITNTMIAQEKTLLVGTYTKKESKGIYTYKFNSKTGELREIAVAAAENPSYLATGRSNKTVYAVLENGDDNSEVAAYSFDEKTGKLKLLNKQPALGAAPCYVSADRTGKWIVTANYGGGNFCVYPVNKDGSIGAAVQNIQHSGKSINTDRQEKAHAHAAVFSPDQKFVAVVDLGTDKIMVYPFDATQAKPVNENAMEVKSVPGAGPRHIVFHTSRPFAYVIEELSGNVTAYRYNGGHFTFMQTISAHPKDFKGQIGSAAIKISPDGKYLYASNRGSSNTIACFSIEPKIGKLRLAGDFSTGGKSPRDFAIDPTGNFLLAANAGSDNVVVFRRNQSTGLPELPEKEVFVPEPVCLVFVR